MDIAELGIFCLNPYLAVFDLQEREGHQLCPVKLKIPDRVWELDFLKMKHRGLI